MQVYILRVACRYEYTLVGIFSSEDKALEYFRRHFEEKSEGVAILANTYKYCIDTAEVDRL